MSNCDFVFTSPDRPNIYYEVCRRTDIDTDMGPFVQSLKEEGVKAPRVIVYCRDLNTCADLYAHFNFELGELSYHPLGAPELSDNRLFGMFHSRTSEHNKDVILKSLCETDGKIRIVFATIALGMGVHLIDVNTIVHYGAPSSIDDYFQASGRGGRSGCSARSIVFWQPADCPLRKELVSQRDHEIAAVREYLEISGTCRRKWLLNYFDSGVEHCARGPLSCCDVCSSLESPDRTT